MLAQRLPRLRSFLPTAHWIIGGLACLGLGVLYFTSRTEVHTFDALSYTWALEDKPFGLLFHPHHLLYGPVGWLAYRVATLFGYVGRADVPVQAVNAAAGALGIFFLWRFGSRWTRRPLTSLGVALTVGFSYAYWVYAAEVEVYTLATAFLMLALWILVLLEEQPRLLWALTLGIAHTGAILFHQTNVLFGLAVGAFLILTPRLRRRYLLLTYAATVIIIVAAAYGYVAYASRFPDWSSFLAWFTDYAQSGQWGGYLSFEHFPALRAGLQTAVSIEPRLAVAFYTAVGLALVAAVSQAWKSARHRAWVAMAGVWLLVYILFFWWWEPWNIEFWIALLPLGGLWILSVWPTDAADRLTANGAARWRSLLPAIGALVPWLFASLLFRAHFEVIQKSGDVSADYYRQVTDALAAIVQPDELVVTRGNVLDLYIPFYADHPHLLSLRTLEQQNGGDRVQIMGELMGQLDWAIVTGRPFLIDQFVLDETREPIRNPFGLLPDEIVRIEERYGLEPLALRGDEPLFYGSPRYDSERRTQWEFTDSLQDWRAWGIEEPHFERDGWCFTSGADPQMKGPIINITAERWTKLIIDLTLEADLSSGQIFWRNPDTDYSLENSLEFPLDRGRHEYVLSLAGAPAWQGNIAQVRLDPVPGHEGNGDPVQACVHAIRFE